MVTNLLPRCLLGDHHLMSMTIDPHLAKGLLRQLKRQVSTVTTDAVENACRAIVRGKARPWNAKAQERTFRRIRAAHLPVLISEWKHFKKPRAAGEDPAGFGLAVWGMYDQHPLTEEPEATLEARAVQVIITRNDIDCDSEPRLWVAEHALRRLIERAGVCEVQQVFEHLAMAVRWSLPLFYVCSAKSAEVQQEQFFPPVILPTPAGLIKGRARNIVYDEHEPGDLVVDARTFIDEALLDPDERAIWRALVELDGQIGDLAGETAAGLPGLAILDVIEAAEEVLADWVPPNPGRDYVSERLAEETHERKLADNLLGHGRTPHF